MHAMVFDELREVGQVSRAIFHGRHPKVGGRYSQYVWLSLEMNGTGGSGEEDRVTILVHIVPSAARGS